MGSRREFGPPKIGSLHSGHKTWSLEFWILGLGIKGFMIQGVVFALQDLYCGRQCD